MVTDANYSRANLHYRTSPVVDDAMALLSIARANLSSDNVAILIKLHALFAQHLLNGRH